MGRVERQRSVLGLFVAATGLIVSFQNCSSSSLFNGTSHSSASQDSAGGGNSQGYDGKVYVHNLDSGVCGDGTTVDGKILVMSADFKQAKVLREKCQSLAPADQRPITVTADFNRPDTIAYAGTSFGLVDKTTCYSAVAGITPPVLDLQSLAATIEGDFWHNQGTGGWYYDFHRGTPANPKSYAQFISADPSYWLFDGDDTLFHYYGATDLIKSFPKKGTKYTIVYEGFMSSGKAVSIVGTGGWVNRLGISLTYDSGAMSLQVGNGTSTPSARCGSANSLCAQGTMVTAQPNDPLNLFGAVSVDEAAGKGLLQANNRFDAFNATYNQDTAGGISHELDIGGIWEAQPDAGSRLFRMRIYQDALTQVQLQQLYAQAATYCPY